MYRALELPDTEMLVGF